MKTKQITEYIVETENMRQTFTREVWFRQAESFCFAAIWPGKKDCPEACRDGI